MRTYENNNKEKMPMNETFEEYIPLTKNKKRAVRRKNSVTKAIRKRDIARQIYCGDKDYYSNLHQYSKNKIHCSCQMCRFRSAWDPNQKTHSDAMKEEAFNYKLMEYMKNEDFDSEIEDTYCLTEEERLYYYE